MSTSDDIFAEAISKSHCIDLWPLKMLEIEIALALEFIDYTLLLECKINRLDVSAISSLPTNSSF